MLLDTQKKPLRGYILQTHDGRPVCVVRPPNLPHPPRVIVLVGDKDDDGPRYFLFDGKLGYREAEAFVMTRERDVIRDAKMLQPRGPCLATACPNLALEGTNFCGDHAALGLKVRQAEVAAAHQAAARAATAAQSRHNTSQRSTAAQDAANFADSAPSRAEMAAEVERDEPDRVAGVDLDDAPSADEMAEAERKREAEEKARAELRRAEAEAEEAGRAAAREARAARARGGKQSKGDGDAD